MRKNVKNKRSDDGENCVAFGCLDITEIDIPLQFHVKYKEYINLLWKTNIIWGFQNLSNRERNMLDQIQYDIIITNNMNQYLVFLSDKKQITSDLRRMVHKLCDSFFAERVKDCMYEDLRVV